MLKIIQGKVTRVVNEESKKIWPEDENNDWLHESISIPSIISFVTDTRLYSPSFSSIRSIIYSRSMS